MIYKRLKKQTIVMHPAPVNRDVEIADLLVEAPKSMHCPTNAKWCICPNGYLRSDSEWQGKVSLALT